MQGRAHESRPTAHRQSSRHLSHRIRWESSACADFQVVRRDGPRAGTPRADRRTTFPKPGLYLRRAVGALDGTLLPLADSEPQSSEASRRSGFSLSQRGRRYGTTYDTRQRDDGKDVWNHLDELRRYDVISLQMDL